MICALGAYVASQFSHTITLEQPVSAHTVVSLESSSVTGNCIYVYGTSLLSVLRCPSSGSAMMVSRKSSDMKASSLLARVWESTAFGTGRFPQT